MTLAEKKTRRDKILAARRDPERKKQRQLLRRKQQVQQAKLQRKQVAKLPAVAEPSTIEAPVVTPVPVPVITESEQKNNTDFRQGQIDALVDKPAVEFVPAELPVEQGNEDSTDAVETEQEEVVLKHQELMSYVDQSMLVEDDFLAEMEALM
jgi:hypothetical protein